MKNDTLQRCVRAANTNKRGETIVDHLTVADIGGLQDDPPSVAVHCYGPKHLQIGNTSHVGIDEWFAVPLGELFRLLGEARNHGAVTRDGHVNNLASWCARNGRQLTTEEYGVLETGESCA